MICIVWFFGLCFGPDGSEFDTVSVPYSGHKIVSIPQLIYQLPHADITVIRDPLVKGELHSYVQ